MTTLRFDVSGLNCGGCAARAEKAMAGVAGVTHAAVNFADHTATVDADSRLIPEIMQAAQKAGYPATPRTTESKATPGEDTGRLARRVILAAALTLPVFAAEMGGHVVPALHHWIMGTVGQSLFWGLQWVLITLVLVGPGQVFYRLGVPALIRGAPDMNSLVVLGASAAWIYSSVATFAPSVLPPDAVVVYFEAAGVIVTLILLGRWLEARAKGQTGAAIKQLIGLRPDTARVDRNGAWVTVAVEDVQVGDVVHLPAGARIPVDGDVLRGAGIVDEAMISGEPIPVEKGQGDPLVAGTINGVTDLVMTARAVGAQTQLARIIDMVSQAQGARLPVQALVNRITLWFVPAVMVIAAATVVAWLMFGTLPQALVAGVSVLIIACPCAMGLATPMSIMVGTGRAAELGVLFRRGDALQSLQSVDIAAFDKTGTLTRGAPQVVSTTLTDDDMARLAALEAGSTHPLAAAILAATPGPLPIASDVTTHPGLGVSGTVDGQHIVAGNAAFLADNGHPDLAGPPADQTPVFVAIDGTYVGHVGILDPIKDSALATIKALEAQGKSAAMISGDTQAAAKAVARQLGLSTVVAGVRPDGKVDAIRDLQQTGRVAFVGDGINDAPALAAADVGVALGTGTDVAVETADVVLMTGDPIAVARAVAISRQTLRNIWQNLGWAFGYNVVLIPVAALGWLSPQLAALAMAASSVLVVGNALRLRWAGGERA